VQLVSFLGRIDNLDLRGGKIETTTSLIIQWKDELLSWNPSDFGGIVSIPLPDDTSWVPEITQTNAPTNAESNLHSMDFKPMWLNQSGHILQYLAGVFETRCIIDSRAFPFDEHVCEFRYFCVKYDKSRVELISGLDNVVLTLFSESTEWELVKTSSTALIIDAGEVIAGHGIETKLFIKRRPALEIMSTFIPGISLGILNLAACFVSPESGERLSFSITAYLSFIFLVSAVQLHMPADAINISALSFSLLAFGILSTASVIWSVFIVRVSVYSTDNRKIPYILHCLLTKNCCVRKKKITPDEQKSGNVDLSEVTEDNSTGTTLSWLQLAKFLDKIFFVISCLIVLIICLVYSGVVIQLHK